jgi:hypothetical protein
MLNCILFLSYQEENCYVYHWYILLISTDNNNAYQTNPNSVKLIKPNTR